MQIFMYYAVLAFKDQMSYKNKNCGFIKTI